MKKDLHALPSLQRTKFTQVLRFVERFPSKHFIQEMKRVDVEQFDASHYSPLADAHNHPSETCYVNFNAQLHEQRLHLLCCGGTEKFAFVRH